MGHFHLKQGYDIPLEGSADPEIVDAPSAKTVAISPADFRGIKPRPLVEEGQAVKIGTPLLANKFDDDHVFGSPASGTVKEIRRGHRRVILQVIIEPDGKNTSESYTRYESAQLAGLSRDVVLAQVKKSGMMAIFRERPFNNAANPANTPRDIFVSTFDSAPLAPDMAVILKGNESFFQAGIDVCSKLTGGKVHLGVRDGEAPAAFAQAKNCQVHRFAGKHPAGNVGVQIHHVAPISGRHDYVWTTDVPGLIRLGKLFLTGTLDASAIVAIVGSGAKSRKYLRTVIGAPIDVLAVKENLVGDVRVISGNALTGRAVQSTDFLRNNDYMLTVLPEAVEPEFIGWMLPGGGKTSWFNVFLGKLMPGKKFAMDTRLGGGHRAMVLTGMYEQVTPMDIYPMYLIKSIMARDFEEMEGLGIYEVVEEDIALCEYICPSKTDFQQILREGIEYIEKEA